MTYKTRVLNSPSPACARRIKAALVRFIREKQKAA